MTTYDVTLESDTLVPLYELLGGGLANGYVVTSDYATNFDMFMRSSTAPGTKKSTVDINDQIAFWGSNDAGGPWAFKAVGGGQYQLYHVYQISGKLYATLRGTTPSIYNFFEPRASHDGTQILGTRHYIAKCVNTSDGSTAFTIDTSTVVGDGGSAPLGLIAANRMVSFDYENYVSQLRLWDGPSGTVIDTLEHPLIVISSAWMQMYPCGPNRLAFVCPSDYNYPAGDYVIGVVEMIDNTLSFPWEPKIISTNWGDHTTAWVCAWGSKVAILPDLDLTPPTSSVSVYVFDADNGDVSSSAPSSNLRFGIYDDYIRFAGPNKIVAHTQPNTGTISNYRLMIYDVTPSYTSATWGGLCPDADVDEQLIAGFENGRWLTSATLSTSQIRLSLYKEGSPNDNTASVLLHTVDIDAESIMDWDEGGGVVAIRTFNGGVYPNYSGHINIIRTDGKTLAVTQHQVPNRGYLYDQDAGWNMKLLHVSADGLEVGIWGSLLVSPFTDYLFAHKTEDFSFAWQFNIDFLFNGLYTDTYAGTIVGLPRENRILVRWIDWPNADNTGTNAGRYQMRLYQPSGLMLSSLYYWDPFYSQPVTGGQWVLHSDGSATYVRTKEAQQ